MTEPAATEPAITSTQELNGTAVLPPTGAIDAGLVSNMMNFDVWDKSGEQIGSAKDVILNLDDQKVDYVVIDVGGFLGLGTKEIPVPWEALQLNAQEAISGTAQAHPNSFTLDVSKDTLDQAPEIDMSSAPQLGQESSGWDAKYQEFWQSQISSSGTSSAAPEASPMPELAASPQITATGSMTATARLQGVALVSELIDAGVKTSDGQDAGAIADVVIDTHSGKVEYVLISQSGSASSNTNESQLTPLPLEVLGWDAQNQVIMLNVDQQTLAGAPGFAKDKFPDTQQPNWDADIQSYWKDYMQSSSQ